MYIYIYIYIYAYFPSCDLASASELILKDIGEKIAGSKPPRAYLYNRSPAVDGIHFILSFCYFMTELTCVIM